MLMLQATRDPGWIDLPLRTILDAVRGVGGTEAGEAREAALRTFEAAVARRPNVFAREHLHGRPYVTLTGLSLEGRMPLRRVVWTQGFADENARDNFFAWLAGHVDRWDDWGALAYGEGADVLTRRFLLLLVEAGGAFVGEVSA